MVWIGISSQCLTRPFFVKPKAKFHVKRNHLWNRSIITFGSTSSKKKRVFILKKTWFFTKILHEDIWQNHLQKGWKIKISIYDYIYLYSSWEIATIFPDSTSCHYFLSGYLKKQKQWNRRKVRSHKGLKKQSKIKLKKYHLK